MDFAERRANTTWNRRTLLKSTIAIGAAVGSIKDAIAARGDTMKPGRSNNTSAGESDVNFWVSGVIGFQLAHEQFPVPQLLELSVAAEEAGFDLLAVSDHLQPWQANEAHSGQAWVTMSAIGQRPHRTGGGTNA